MAHMSGRVSVMEPEPKLSDFASRRRKARLAFGGTSFALQGRERKFVFVADCVACPFQTFAHVTNAVQISAASHQASNLPSRVRAATIRLTCDALASAASAAPSLLARFPSRCRFSMATSSTSASSAPICCFTACAAVH